MHGTCVHACKHLVHVLQPHPPSLERHVCHTACRTMYDITRPGCTPGRAELQVRGTPTNLTHLNPSLLHTCRPLLLGF